MRKICSTLGVLIAFFAVLSAQQTQFARLELYTPIKTGTASIEVNKEYVLAVRVRNLGTSTWKGGLFLKVNGQDIGSEYATIPAEKNKAFLIRGRWTPSHGGQHKVELFYQTNGNGRGRLVAPGEYSNPQYLYVENNQDLQPKICLVATTGFTRSIIELGQSVRYVSTIGNKGNKDWSGVLYLKSEGKDIHHWSVRINKGASQNIIFDYLPTSIGTREYYLYAQEGGVGRGTLIDGNGYSNPVSLTVKAASKGKVSLSRAMGFGGATTLEQGKSSRFTATVSSDKDWSGVLFLKNGSQNIHHWSVRLTKGVAQTVTFDYTPTTTGTQVLTLYAQEGGEGAGVVVDRNGYSNPIRISVKAASKGKVSLSRAMGFGGATTLEQGKSSRFTATVSSDKDWS
ncbi:MAG: hypothetical protein Q4A57_00005, partial [Porphyromonas circumdentaria]|nr:hypothetical protein [Porphyromonas circumdentaria]